jgi:hypothetical protein
MEDCLSPRFKVSLDNIGDGRDTDTLEFIGLFEGNLELPFFFYEMRKKISYGDFSC